MTNIYGLPLETVIVVDREKHTQSLGYSIIPDKSEDSFSTFIYDYISLCGSPFRIIVVDRLEAQYEALIHKFRQSFIIFCLVHIRCDLISHFGSNNPIIAGFDNVKKNPINSFYYLNFLISRKKELGTSKGAKCLEILIQR